MGADPLLRRPYQAADAPALANLMNAIELHGGGRAGHTADALHRLITTLVRTPESDSTMLFEPGGRLVAAGFTTTPPPEGSLLYLTGGVHPEWRGRGIGRDLVGRHLARARDIHRTTANGATWQLMAHNQCGNADAARLLERFGLQPVRYWFDMAAPVRPEPPLPPPPTVELVPYAPAHEDAVYRTHQETFTETWGFQRRDQSSWRTLTVAAKTFRPELSFVALAPGIAGFVLTYDNADEDRVYVGLVGVTPAWRRRGVASALLTQVLHSAAQAGHTTVELHVDAASPTGAVSVYEKIGFTTESNVVTHALTLAP